MYFASNNLGASTTDLRFFSNDGSGATLAVLGSTGEVGDYAATGQSTPYGTKEFYITRSNGNYTSLGVGTSAYGIFNHDNAVFTPGTDPGDANRDIIVQAVTSGRPSTLSLKDGSSHNWDLTNGGSANSDSLYGSFYNGTYSTKWIFDTSGNLTLAGTIKTQRSEERRVGKECRSRW